VPRAVRAAPITLVVSAFTMVVACTAGTDVGVRAADPTAGTSSTSTRAETALTTAGLTGARGPRGSGQPVSFAFAGDTQFPDVLDTEPGSVSSGVPLADQLRADPTHVLDPIAPTLSAADLAMVNLETAITERGEPVPIKNFHFRSPAASFTALRAAGVDVVNMANNHALDYGPVGMDDTFAAIESSNFPVVGIGHDAAEAYRPYRTVIKDQRIAIFGALDNVEPALIPAWGATDSKPGVALSTERARLLDAITAARPDADTVVVFMHWGTEQTHCASPAQVDLTRDLLAAGADIIVGSHEHREFGAGRVGNSFVAYGLGNFVH
jgi:Bacterial capsule synthesis protein PGA_cap